MSLYHLLPPSSVIPYIKENIKLITFTAETPLPGGRQGDRREEIVFDLVVRGHQIKSSQPFGHLYGHRPGASGESASHRFSRKTSSLSGLCALNESRFLGTSGR
jgi:hypothetical protein